MPPFSPYVGAHLRWPVERLASPFAVRVVEPTEYRPEQHDALFFAVVQDLLGSPRGATLDRHEPVPPPTARRVDLVTFPEAFATADALLIVADEMRSEGPSGCIHVGLRPDEGPSHLFSVRQLRDLHGRLSALLDPSVDDLEPFGEWLARQDPEHRFNIGCVLAVDAELRLRACLHPKLVRSKFEEDALPDRNMEEGDLLTLITLVPTRPLFGTMTLQPLLCSDALRLSTDRKAPPPIAAVSSHADCLPDPPNHVDVVSVATCTPQPRTGRSDGGRYAAWHQQFRQAFVASAEEAACARHHFCVFVLANYTELSEGLRGGLSGTFMPVPQKADELVDGLTVSCWGRRGDGADNAWSSPDDDALRTWRCRGFVAGLDPESEGAGAARVLDFRINRLPREASLWDTRKGIVSIRIRSCARDETGAVRLQTGIGSDEER